MKTLCMDSSHKNLVLVLLEDGEVKASCSQVCWKKQSETVFPELIKLMEQAQWDSDDIEEVVISEGPGSYTGVRIAMAIAKVLCTTKKLPLYCISTLQLYAGLHEQAFVMLDARSQRAYCALLDKGSFKREEAILTLAEIKSLVDQNKWTLYGDCELIEKESATVDFVLNFKELRRFARKVDNIHTLTPRYLKEQDAYLVK